jgi:AraC-like DNA-binding protein
MSADYFNRLCRATLNMSAERWVIKQRVEAAAARLVESDRSIGEVADEYGYSSLYFFSRQFRMVQGVSPREFRARYGARLAES